MENEKKRSFLKEYLITSVVSFLVGIGLFCLFFFTKNLTLVSACDATAITGIILICFGLLFFIAREGFFDFASYGFKQLGSMIFSKKPNEYNDYASYRENKNVIRQNASRYYWFVCLVGLVFVTAFIILRIILLAEFPL